jgi:hypothetical protein
MAKKLNKSADLLGIKIARTSVERARELSELVARNGWASVDVDRADPATLKAVLEAAIDVLYERATRRK